MRPRALFAAAARDVATRPLRSALTAIGVALATAALVALVALSRGIQVNVLEHSSTPFLTIVQVLPAQAAAGASARALDDGALWDIRAAPHVREAIPAIVVPVSVATAGRQVGGTLIGLSPAGPAPYALSAGRAPSSTETDGVVLTPAGVRALGLSADAAVGLMLQVSLRRGDTRTEQRTVTLRVAGVSADDIPGQLAVTSLAVADDAIAWIATGESAAARDVRLAQQAAAALLFGGRVVAADLGGSRYTTIWAFADSVADVRDVARAIERLGFGTYSTTALSQTIDDAFRVVNGGLASIALIALLIAALGIANAMVTTVSERTVEIGVLKALGATDETVQALVLAQGAMLGLIGGMAGVLLGTAMAVAAGVVVRGVISSAGFAPVVDPALGAGALGVALAVSLLASSIPARRAAALVPADALRSE
ncbi:MAG TPA: FtsX-like permease family protein [Candidatus Limnocylindria bacterium]|nr:FtsX-like permease family protein [Candidatus Limnocylindria bacterium]